MNPRPLLCESSDLPLIYVPAGRGERWRALRVFNNGGGQQGTSTFIMLVPERGEGVVVLINMDGLDASALATDLMTILVGNAGKSK